MGLQRLTLWLALALGCVTGLRVGAADASSGVAVEIVYDTSGSMLQKVRDADGKQTPKHVIASRAVRAVLDQLDVVSATPGAGPIHVGLIVFDGDHAIQAVKLGPYDSKAIRSWLREHDKPMAGTPLGDAVRIAGEALLKSSLPRKHVLIITDGINTKGPDPTVTVPRLQEAARRKEAPLSFHFVAFDVNAAEFSGVKKLGATVVGAADEKQLTSQLEFIVAKKILLEDEEPPTAKPQTK
jgi:hypothetical protein